MHARYYSPMGARFLSVDPVGGSVGSSQSWNRYAYTLNNPLKYTDPDGREIAVAVHKVLRNKKHVSARVTPENQAKWSGNENFKFKDAQGRHYATFGASRVNGKLVSQLNRSSDRSKMKTEVKVLDLGGRDEDTVIEALLEADSNYDDQADYDLLPELLPGEGYNSNSYLSGLLRAVGLEPPALKPSVPGYVTPLPEEEFLVPDPPKEPNEVSQ